MTAAASIIPMGAPRTPLTTNAVTPAAAATGTDESIASLLFVSTAMSMAARTCTVNPTSTRIVTGSGAQAITSSTHISSILLNVAKFFSRRI